MLRSYLTIALRNLKRYRFYALLNVVGLSIGVASLLIAIIYADQQFSFHRQHENLDRIYRVVRKITDTDGTRFEVKTKAVANRLEGAFPEVEQTVKVFNRLMWISSRDVGFNQKVACASPRFLDVFTYPLVKGDPESLKRPGAAFITQSVARKLFGEDEAIGRIVSVDYKWFRGDFEVTGILEDIPLTNDSSSGSTF
jgi:putative ABC transport system permease protein